MFIFILLIILTLLWYKRNVYDWRRKGVNGELPFPIIGTSWLFIRKYAFHVDLDCLHKFGDYFIEYQPLLGCLLNVTDLPTIRQVLVKNFNVFSDKFDLAWQPKYIRYSLISISGLQWKRIRSIVTPIFTSGRLRSIASGLKQPVDNSLEDIQLQLDLNKPTKLDIKEWCNFVSVDIIAKVVFSMNVRTSSSHDQPFFKNVFNFNQITLYQALKLNFTPRILNKLLKVSFFNDNAINYFAKMSENLMKERRENPNVKYNDFLQLLMDAEGAEDVVAETDSQGIYNRRLTSEEIVGQCLFFFLAGVDTIANTITAVLYELANNQEVQDKLYQELLETVANSNNYTLDEISKCKYLDCVVQESLRLHPSVTKLFRKATEDIQLENGLKIKKGQSIAIPVYAIHHHADYFENPNEFIPERFETLDLNVKQYGFLPFSTGPMNCVGNRFAIFEVKYYLAKFLLKFKVNLCSDGSTKFNFVNISFLLNFYNLNLDVSSRH